MLATPVSPVTVASAPGAATVSTVLLRALSAAAFVALTVVAILFVLGYVLVAVTVGLLRALVSPWRGAPGAARRTSRS